MENPHSSKTSGDFAAVSSTRTDYGSTTLKIATRDGHSNGAAGDENDDEILAGSADAADTGYQSLPYCSSTNLFRYTRRTEDSLVILESRRHRLKMTFDKSPNGEARQLIERLELGLSVLNQICIGFVTIYMSWLCLRTGLAGTALHAWLVTIGFSFLMAEAIMAHYSGNVLTFNYKRTTKTTIHWMLQAVGGACGVAGALIKLIQKGFSLHSVHGKLGFAALILCLVTMLSGLCALFSTRVKQILNPLLNKSLHNILGIGAFVVALLAQYYGYETGFFSRKVSHDFQTLMKCVTLLSLVLSCIGPLKALYQKCCSIVRHYN